MRAELCTLWNDVSVLRVVPRRPPSQERSHYMVERICLIFGFHLRATSLLQSQSWVGVSVVTRTCSELWRKWLFNSKANMPLRKSDVEHLVIFGGQRRTRTVTEIQRGTHEPDHRDLQCIGKDMRCHDASSVRRSAVRTRLSGCAQRQS